MISWWWRLVNMLGESHESPWGSWNGGPMRSSNMSRKGPFLIPRFLSISAKFPARVERPTHKVGPGGSTALRLWVCCSRLFGASVAVNGGAKKTPQTPQACWKYCLQSAHSQLERGLDGQQDPNMDQQRGTFPRMTTYYKKNVCLMVLPVQSAMFFFCSHPTSDFLAWMTC